MVILPLWAAVWFLLSFVFSVVDEAFLGILIFLILLFGLILESFSRRYQSYNGQLVISKDETGKLVYLLELDTDPIDILDLDSISFKVIDKQYPEE